MKSLVIFSCRPPGPITKGDQVILDAKLRNFTKDSDITLICPRLSKNERLFIKKRYGSALKVVEFQKGYFDIMLGLFRCFVKKMPFHYALCYSVDAKRKILKEVGQKHLHVMLGRSMINIPESHCPTTLDFVDSGFLALKNRTRSIIARKLYSIEAKRSCQFETMVSSMVAYSSAVSIRDASAISPSVDVVPNGVNLFPHCKSELSDPQQAASSLKIVMSGNFGYPPNIEGANYLINLYRASDHRKSISLHFVGKFSKKLQTMVTTSAADAIYFRGTVPDLQKSLLDYDIAAAILPTGTGIQNKVLEGYSVGLPILATPNVISGLPQPNQIGVFSINSQSEFDNSIKTLRSNQKRVAIGDYNYNHCKRFYDWESRFDALKSIVKTDNSSQ